MERTPTPKLGVTIQHKGKDTTLGAEKANAWFSLTLAHPHPLKGAVPGAWAPKENSDIPQR